VWLFVLACIREARFIRYHIRNEAVVAVVHTLKTLYCPGE